MHPIPSRAGSTSQDTGLQRISQRVCERFTTRGSLLERRPSLAPGAKPQPRLNRNPIAQLSKIRQQTTDFHRRHRARSVVCARAGQQQSGRPGLSNKRPAPRLPPQATASAILSWPASNELANLCLSRSCIRNNPLRARCSAASSMAKTARRIARATRSMVFRIFDMAGSLCWSPLCRFSPPAGLVGPRQTFARQRQCERAARKAFWKNDPGHALAVLPGALGSSLLRPPGGHGRRGSGFRKER